MIREVFFLQNLSQNVVEKLVLDPFIKYLWNKAFISNYNYIRKQTCFSNLIVKYKSERIKI